MSNRNFSTFSSTLFVTVCLLFSPANAVLFDFGAGPDNQNMLQFIQGGITLDVTSAGGFINQNGVGLGVHGNPGGGRVSGNESLTFVFSPSVSIIESVIFENGGGTDNVAIKDGLGNLLTTLFLTNNAGNSEQTFSGLNLIGDTFVFSRAGGSNPTPGFRVSELTVNAIPLPAALPLFAGGLGIMGLIGWRRKRRATACLTSAPMGQHSGIV